MSFINSCGNNIFVERFSGSAGVEVIYVPGHKEIPYEKYKAPKIKDFCLKNGVPFAWFDYMGYGRSEGEKSVWQLTEWLQNLTDVVDASPYKKQILVGYSMGGYLMLAEALLRPQKIKALFGFSPGFGKSFQTLSPTSFISDKDGRIKIDIKNTSGFNYIEQNLDIACPAQFLFSYDDESVDIKSADYLRVSVARSAVIKVRGVGHVMENDDLIGLCNNFIRLAVGKD